MRAALLWMVMLVGSTLGCRGSATPDRTKEGSASSAGLDFTYGVDAARPRTSFDLHVPPTGDAELYLGATPEGADTLGYFRAPVSAEARAALAELVQDHDLLSRTAAPSFNPEGSGFLRVASGAKKGELSLVSADEAVTALRTKLDAIAADVAHHPLRALRLSVTATREGAAWRPTITLTQVGTEPLSALFFDLADPVFCLHASAATGTRGPTSELARSDVAALVQSGALPGGVTDVPVGAVYHLPLPPLTAAAPPELSGSVTFWLPGTGLSRRAVELHARGVAH